ncbi:hypothetical protein AAFC00_006958 [Neodothiora populina]|uniref:FAD dependent oxidoreductase domain-containing protein n=1 Tax=Neodothiora populina TaxID=2781224 RepID=A0ABR3PCB7_9PEZI
MNSVKKVAVIGAGVSGVSTAAHLKREGLDVTVFERSPQAGGVWVYNERLPREPAYPSTLPSLGDSPGYERILASRKVVEEEPLRDRKPARSDKADSPMEEDEEGQSVSAADLVLLHAPPGPCYVGLKNNVSTIEMELRTNSWPSGTEEYVPHTVIAEYIQDTARKTGLDPVLRFNTRVEEIQKEGAKWSVRTSELISNEDEPSRVCESTEDFDAVVVASGHYHACNIPDIRGLKEWKAHWPDRVFHSKSYRNASGFENQNILIIGSGVSAWDISRELAPSAANIYQVSRGGAYDLAASMFPTIRVGDIAGFQEIVKNNNDDVADNVSLAADSSIPLGVHLKSGETLTGIHKVILCTGYHMSYPFLRAFHDDSLSPEDANDTVLVTREGQRTHNLHKDIFYIPDPTLAFIGVPYHVATFSCFDFQGMAVAAVYSGRSSLPSEVEMRREYVAKTAEKSAGRSFHSLRGEGEEIKYVNELMDIVNQRAVLDGRPLTEGHTKAWHESYARRVAKNRARHGVDALD